MKPVKSYEEYHEMNPAILFRCIIVELDEIKIKKLL